MDAERCLGAVGGVLGWISCASRGNQGFSVVKIGPGKLVWRKEESSEAQLDLSCFPPHLSPQLTYLKWQHA